MGALAVGIWSFRPLGRRYFHSFGGSALRIKLTQSLRHLSDPAIADGAPVNGCHTGQFSHCAGAENLTSSVNIFQRQIGFPARDSIGGADSF